MEHHGPEDGDQKFQTVVGTNSDNGKFTPVVVSMKNLLGDLARGSYYYHESPSPGFYGRCRLRRPFAKSSPRIRGLRRLRRLGKLDRLLGKLAKVTFREDRKLEKVTKVTFPVGEKLLESYKSNFRICRKC